MFSISYEISWWKRTCLYGGSLLAYSPIIFIKILIVGATLTFLVGYICVLPISASILLPVLYGFAEKDLIGMSMLMFVGAIIIWRHKENLIRIKMDQKCG